MVWIITHFVGLPVQELPPQVLPRLHRSPPTPPHLPVGHLGGSGRVGGLELGVGGLELGRDESGAVVLEVARRRLTGAPGILVGLLGLPPVGRPLPGPVLVGPLLPGLGLDA